MCYDQDAMTRPVPNDPVLTRFCATVMEIYGDRVERVVLFGSRAHDDAKPDSDYDEPLAKLRLSGARISEG